MRNYSKILITIALILLAFITFKFIKTAPVDLNQVENVNPSEQNNNLGVEDGVFKNNEFTFKYQKDLIANDYNETSSWRTNTSLPGDFHVGIIIPRSIQPNTNFSDAKFTIGSSDNPTAVSECLIQTNGEREKGETEINGTLFKKITLTEGAAGNYYDTTSYRATKDGKCYAVEYTIHSMNLRNYPAEENIQEFNTPFIVEILEDMARSFEFM